MRGALEDLETCALGPAERALLRFVHRLNEVPASISAADMEQLYAVGWDDEAIYDAASVCALFNFYNRWIDATGVHGSAAVYAASGKRIAHGGYSR